MKRVKQIGKRCFSLLLTSLMCLGPQTIHTFAAENFEIEEQSSLNEFIVEDHETGEYSLDNETSNLENETSNFVNENKEEMDSLDESAGIPSADEAGESEIIAEIEVESETEIEAYAADTAVINQIQNGGTVTLNQNLTVTRTINITKDTTLNLNGCNVTYTGSTGSIFHVTAGTFTLTGNGTVSGGKGTNVKWDEIVDREKTNGEPAGGAVLVDSGATFKMNGGTISGNKATWGGGIAVARGGHLQIYGGSITDNTAASSKNDTLSGAATGKYGGGGGIFCAGNGVIQPVNGDINISNNKTNTVNDLGGGGIFIESKGTMKIYNAEVTGNIASGQGGGVAGCLHGKVTNLSPQTAAIYGNTASGTARVTRLSAIDHNGWWYGKNGVVTANDYFCAGYNVIGSVSMNGGNAAWTGWKVEGSGQSVTNVSVAKTDPIVVQGVVGLNAGSGNDVAEKAASFKGNKVVITGNTSKMHGGGIGCNGTLSFGEESFSYSTSKINIEASKTVEVQPSGTGAMNPAGYEFELVKDNHVMATAVTDGNGKISFKDLNTSVLFGSEAKTGILSATLTLREVAGTQNGMVYDTDPREILITVQRTDKTVGGGNITTGSGGLDVTTHVFTDVVQSVQVKVNGQTIKNGAVISDDKKTISLSSSAAFTNVMQPLELTVQKTWIDAENQDAIRPRDITVYLKKNSDSNPYRIAILNAENGWKTTFTDLPAVDANGQKIEYTVEEVEVSNYIPTYAPAQSVTVDTAPADKTITITNTYNPEKTHVWVEKIWEDNNNQDGIRPVSIEVELLKRIDSTEEFQPAGVTVELNAENGWKASFTGLDKYSNGTKIEYAVKEANADANGVLAVEGGAYQSAVETTGAENYFKIINTHVPETTSLSVKKEWDDANNQAGNRPESIFLVLYAGDKPVDEATVTLDASGNWEYTFENLPMKKNGVDIVYTVREVKKSGYSADYVYNREDKANQSVVITNTYTPDTTSVWVEKIWEDADNQDGVRVESILIQLLANGEEVEGKTLILSEGNWSGSFSDLPIYKEGAQGEVIDYSVAEKVFDSETGEYVAVEQSDYKVSYDKTEDGGFNITNKYAPEVISVQGTKTWDDNDNQDGVRPSLIRVSLLADGEIISTVVVTEEENWSWSFENLPRFKNGTEIKYSVTEKPVEHYTTEVNGFDIINHYTPGKTSVPVTKVWDDEDNVDGLRTESVTIELIRNGEKTEETLVLSAENNWNGVFDDLDLYENGERIQWTVHEIAVHGYQSVVSGSASEGYVVTNILIGENEPEISGPVDPEDKDEENTPDSPEKPEDTDSVEDESAAEVSRPDTGGSPDSVETNSPYLTTNSGGTATRPESGGLTSNPSVTAQKASTAAASDLWIWSALVMGAALTFCLLFFMKKKSETGSK